jgi:hypothetical protein
MFFLSVTGSSFAQIGDEDFLYNLKWNQHFEVNLKNNTKVYIQTTVSPLMQEAVKYKLDSLLKSVMLKYKNIEEKSDEIDAKTVNYSLFLNDNNSASTLNKEAFSVKVHQPTEKKYGIIKGTEYVRLKTLKDTLIINIEYKNLTVNFPKPNGGFVLRYGFIVNNLADLDSIDTDYVQHELLTQINKKSLKIRRFNSFQDDPAGYMAKHKLAFNTLSSTYTNNTHRKILSVDGNFNLGYVQDHIAGGIESSISLLSNNRVAYGLGTNIIWSSKRLPDGSVKMIQNAFLGGVFTLYQKSLKDSRTNFNKLSKVSSFSIGYSPQQSNNNRKIFEGDTWRIAISRYIASHVAMEVELYLEKQEAYPGIRFKFM